jgi:hypothetical protein
MITIRNAQMAALQQAQLPSVLARLTQYVREHHAASTAQFDDALLGQMVGAGVRRAQGWGFETMFGLGLFVALMFEVAPDFDTDPRIHAALGTPSCALDDCLAGIADVLADDEWEQLAQRANALAWLA